MDRPVDAVRDHAGGGGLIPVAERPRHSNRQHLPWDPPDLRGLTLAIAAAQSGSIRLAAQRAGLTPSALSRKIRALEDVLGVSLFERRSTGLRPTAAGAQFLDAAQRLMREWEAAMSRARDAGAASTGRAVIGTYFSASHGRFRDALIRFIQEHSSISVMLMEGRHDELLQAARDGRADLAVLLDMGAAPGLEQAALWQERGMVALPTAHPLASNKFVRWQDLIAETFLVARRYSGPSARAIVQALLPPGNAARFVDHDVSREGMFNLVGAGLGVAVLAESAAGVRYPGVIFRQLGDDAGETRVQVSAYWDPKHDNPAARRFLALLRTAQRDGSSGVRDG